MSDLSEALETMMAALADAMDVWKRIGERIETQQDRIGRIESRLAALALRTDMLLQAEKTRALPAIYASGEIKPGESTLQELTKRIEVLERDQLPADWKADVDKSLDNVWAGIQKLQALSEHDGRLGPMFKGIAKRLTALEDEVVSLRSCLGRQQ